jgi:O-antigen/teichoic acid export membrane protein
MRIQIKNNIVLIKFLSSNIFGAIIGIFTGFFTYRYIEPSQLGIWGVFAIIEVYFSVTRLGIINGLGRELPFYLGQDNQEKANSIAQTALSYSLWSNLFLVIIIPITLILNNINLSNEYYAFSFVVILLRLVLNSYSSYLSVTFRTNSNFNDLSNLTFFQSGIKVFSLFFVYNFGFWGLLIREVLLSITETSLLHLKRPFRIQPKFQLKFFLELFKIGFPLFVVSYLSGIIDTFPRLFIIKYGSTEQLGLFSPIIVILGLSVILPNAISSYMYPKMAFKYGSTSNGKELWTIIKKTSYLSVLSALPISIIVYFGSDLMGFFFPKYENSILYLKISSISLLFVGFKAGSISFSVMKNWTLMFLDVVFFFVTTGLSLYIFKYFFTDILLITTLSMIFTNIIMFFITLVLAYKATH